MKLFKTTSRRTYRKPRQNAGWSTTLKAKTRLKRWARRSRKKLWRQAKQRTKRTWRRLTPKHQAHQRQITRRAQQFRRNNAQIHARTIHPTPSAAAEGGKLPPPPDGAIAHCRRCSNEVQYNSGRQRWEHTSKGHAECFQPGGYA